MSKLNTGLHVPLVLITVAAACTVAMPAAAAEKASRQENVGVATGFTVGAVAGGPLGAILGAAAGAWLGDRYHRQSVQLASTETERARLAQSTSELTGSLADAKHDAQRLNETLERTRDLETVVSFRTGDASLEPEAESRLRKWAALASAVAGTDVRVAGFADPRGSEQLNAALSERRASVVAAVLKSAGLPAERVVVESHGAAQSTSADGDLDAYAFDRRVTVRIEAAATAKEVARAD